MKPQAMWHLSSVASIVTMFATAAVSQDVTIQTVDGNVSIQGKIISFDGENYELDSTVGTMTIPVGAVICLGDACPEIDDGSSLTANVAVIDAPSTAVFNNLVASFANERGFTFSNDAAGDNTAAVNIADSEDKNVGTLTVSQLAQRDAFLALLDGDTKFVISSAPISDELAESLIADGHPDMRAPGREVIVALDAIVPVVHPSNNIRDLSLPVLARIAAGRVQNWNELGGPDLPIRLVLAQEGTSVYDMVDERIMRPNRLRLDRALETVADEAAAELIVSQDPGAITLTSNALVDATKPIPIRQVCGPLSVPTNFSVKAEEYPLARRVLIYTSGEPLAESMKDFISFAGSAQAQAEYINAGFVGQTVETVPMSLQGSRLTSAILYADTPEIFETTRTLTETLTLADRLSTTFRFEAGSTDLDNKSRRDAVRIAEHLMLPENRDREILLFGFTDSVGRDDLNQLLSLEQAVSISNAIVDASTGQISRDRIKVTSFGSVAPVGCNETVEGRNSNRRVEVWLR